MTVPESIAIQESHSGSKSKLSKREIQHVQATNDSSILSKRSMEMQGYLADEEPLLPTYLSCVVPMSPKRAPLINRGYWIRYFIVKDYVMKFIDKYRDTTRPVNIVSFGCGFDTMYFTLSHQYNADTFRWYDTDFPALLERKKVLIDTHEELKNIADTNKNYIPVGVDLCRLRDLSQKIQVLGADRTLPTLFVSECAITYMPTGAADALIAWTAKEFENPYFLLYEQIVPDDPFGQTMTAHFQQLNSPLQSIQTYPSLRCQRDRFINLGYDTDVYAYTLLDIWQGYVPSTKKDYINHLEPFDETEDWLLKCQHYMIIMAGKDPERNLDLAIASSLTEPKSTSNIILQHVQSVQNPLLQRVGHTVTLVGDKIVVFGGYKTKRLADVIIKDLEGQVLHHIEADKNGPTPRMHHCAAADNNKRSLYIYGGRSSPNTVFDDLWRFNLEDHSWSLVKQNNPGPGPRFRCNCKSVEHGTQVDEWIFDVTTAKWSLDIAYAHNEVPEDPLTWRNADRHLKRTWMNNRSQVVHDSREGNNRWISIGGGGCCFSFKSWWNDAVMIWNTWNIQEILNQLEPDLPSFTNEDALMHVQDPSDDLYRLLWTERKPFLVETKNWKQKAHTLWNDEAWLKKKVGQKRVSVHIGSSETVSYLSFHERNFKFQYMTISQLLDLMGENQDNDRPIYLRSIGDNPRKDVACVFKSFPSLFEDFYIPPTLGSYFSSALRVASGKCTLWPHYDVMDNILIQLRGKKKVQLWPSGGPTLKGLDIASRGATSAVTDISSDLNDLTRKYSYVITLEPGQALCIPAGWGHHVEALKKEGMPMSIGVNVFWKDERIIELENQTGQSIYPDRDLYGNRDLLPGQNAMDEVEKEVLECLNNELEVTQQHLIQEVKDIYTKLDILPNDIANFYKWKCWSRLKETLLSV